jgi:hypothetical protein
MKTTLVILAAFAAAAAVAQPVVTNYTTSVYAFVPDPLALSFAADGTLYVGRDNSGSGGGSGDAVKIHRVALGGSPVTEFGNDTIPDPDAVIVDEAGLVSGTAGAVLVGGAVSGSSGRVSKIAPDGTVTDLFGTSTLYDNPTGFAFDAAGRLFFTTYGNGRVYRADGGAPLTPVRSSGATPPTRTSPPPTTIRSPCARRAATGSSPTPTQLRACSWPPAAAVGPA